MVESKSRRRRGGQPGNSNALKHGFYSRRFQDAELTDLDAAAAIGLENEIALLRVSVRRLFDLVSEESDLGIEEWGQVLTWLGMTSTRIATLIRTHKTLTGDNSGLTATISQALSEVVKEMKLK